MGAMSIGLQLYTVREDLKNDIAGTLREVAAMGYEGVEFAGYGELSAEQMRDLLQELNLKAIGSHISLQRLDEQLDYEIAYLKTIGAAYGVCPYIADGDRKDAAAWEAVIAKFDRIGEAFRQNGLQFGYHNHAFEFEMELDGEFVFDAMYTKVNAERLFVEMDLGWVQYAGQDPLAYIAKYKGRLPLLHLKDFREGPKDQPIDTVELGNGDLDLNSILDAASKADVEWIIVEQDTCKNPPMQAVRTSREWLKQNYK